MPEENAETPAAAGSGVKLNSLKGGLIVVGIMLVQALFFGTLLYFKDKPPEAPKQTDENPAGLDPADIQRTIVLGPLTYTIYTPGQGGGGTLQMVAVMELGTTREERESKSAPTEAQLEVFKNIINSYTDRLRDHLNTFIPRLGLGILQSPNGQQYITDEIRRFINDGLKEMHIKDMPPPEKLSRERVTKVLLREYMLQPNG